MREVIMESILILKHPKGHTANQGCVFEGHFKKNRGFYGSEAEPFEAALQNGVWTYKKLAIRNYDLVVDLYNDGITLSKDIAEEVDISRQAVEKHLKRAQAEGDIK